MFHPRSLIAALLVGALIPVRVSAQATAPPAADPVAALESTLASAEESLRAGEFQVAESRYRAGLMVGWMLIGSLDGANGQISEARQAYLRASMVTVQPRDALQALALVDLLEGNPSAAINTLAKLVARNGKDVESRRLLAQALASAGQAGLAVQELEEASQVAPDDLELRFALASGYLRLKKPEAAAKLFDQIAAARPQAATWVLIGRTYRDAGVYTEARTALQRALKLDPKVRRAHYYLGTSALLENGLVGLDDAIVEFKRELAIAPDDPITTMRLGIALVLANKPAEALPLLDHSCRIEPPISEAFHFRGRALLALGRPDEAVAALERALAIEGATGESAQETLRTASQDRLSALRNIHYQLGQALRITGRVDEAATQFEIAERLSERVANVARDDLTKFMADTPDPQALNAKPPVETVFPLVAMPQAQRAQLHYRASMAVARGYFNLGVMQMQAGRPARAAEMFAQTVALSPSFPQAQFSLGVAHFNAKQYQEAIAPLERAAAERVDASDVKRMLAMACLNAGVNDKAADLLRNDPRRDTDPSLQYAFGVALSRANRPEAAAVVFEQLLADHPDMPEVNVALGQANAAEGDYDKAIAHLKRALVAKPDVAEANATLGNIYMRQGRIDEAEAALRAEIASHPGDLQARHTLAAVLEQQEKFDEAITHLRIVLRAKPDFADARYQLGKILLTTGAADEAAAHLEAAAQLAPDDANVHYQLGKAYTRLGQPERAQEAFDRFLALKDKRDGRTK